MIFPPEEVPTRRKPLQGATLDICTSAIKGESVAESIERGEPLRDPPCPPRSGTDGAPPEAIRRIPPTDSIIDNLYRKNLGGGVDATREPTRGVGKGPNPGTRRQDTLGYTLGYLRGERSPSPLGILSFPRGILREGVPS